MPSDSAPATKGRTTKSTSSPDVDHRKRRRNRTTQSCLNCHATKRMCDRKRPCSRCIQLGLTGLCVYEIDDPAKQPEDQDESSRLLKRIAELEGVVRELKHRPHPRWVDTHDAIPLDFPGGATSPPLRSPSYVKAQLRPVPSFGDMAWSDLLNWDSRSSDSSYSRSPVSTPSPLLVPTSRPAESFLSHDSTWSQRIPIPRQPDPACSCMNEPACYNATLELASELRRTAATVSRSVNHCFGSPCTLVSKMCELESLTVDALRRSHVCPDAMAAAVRVNGVYRPLNDVTPAAREHQTKMITRDPFWDENGLPAYDDSFMSWISPATAVQKLI